MMLMKNKQSHEFKGLIIEGQGNLVKTKEDYSKVLKKEENLLYILFCECGLSFCQGYVFSLQV